MHNISKLGEIWSNNFHFIAISKRKFNYDHPVYCNSIHFPLTVYKTCNTMNFYIRKSNKLTFTKINVYLNIIHIKTPKLLFCFHAIYKKSIIGKFLSNKNLTWQILIFHNKKHARNQFYLQ